MKVEFRPGQRPHLAVAATILLRTVMYLNHGELPDGTGKKIRELLHLDLMHPFAQALLDASCFLTSRLPMNNTGFCDACTAPVK